MKILFVLNNFFITGNGLAASARRTVEYLRKAGHEVRIMSGPNHKDPSVKPDYPLEDYKFPIVQPIIRAQGYFFAQSNLPLMEEAARWADVIHLEEPFVIEDRMIKICERLGKPVTGTYHLHPENITNSLGPLVHWKRLNRKILTAWRDLTFNHCDYVQCPTENVLDRLRRYHIDSQMELISNGVVPDQCIREENPPEDYEDPNRPLKVVYIGRLSKEKDQPTLLEAMRHSQYAKESSCILPDRGPPPEASSTKPTRSIRKVSWPMTLYSPSKTVKGFANWPPVPIFAFTAPPSRWKACPLWKRCNRVPFPSSHRADSAERPSLPWTVTASFPSVIRKPSPTASSTGWTAPKNAGKWERNTLPICNTMISGSLWNNCLNCFRKPLTKRKAAKTFLFSYFFH